jgi:putative drug exporter of the RND superfamily
VVEKSDALEERRHDQSAQGFLRRLGRFAARRHWWFLVGWVVVLVAVWATAISLGGSASNNFTLPGSPAQDSYDQLAREFPSAAGTSATVVYHLTDGADFTTDSAVQASVAQSVTAIEALDRVSSVTSPLKTPQLVSKDGSTALATVTYSVPFSDLPDNGVPTMKDLQDAIAPYRSSSLEIELGGSMPGAQPIDVQEVFVVIGLLVALVILLFALATWWSFPWPVVGALVGVVLGVGLVRILERFVDIPTISDTAAVMIGLGVGTDYALFVMSRAKDYVDQGESPVDAAAHAAATVGRTVVTAGATVLIALFALLIFQVPSVTAMAYAIAITVAAVVLSAVTLVPAVVGLVGARVSTSKVPWARDDDRPGLGARWVATVTRFAPVSVVAGVTVLLVFAIPVFKGDLRLGPLDNSLFPTDSTQYKAWQRQSEAFGAGSTNPFLVLVEIPSQTADTQTQLTTFYDDLVATKDVTAVAPPTFDPAGTLGVYQLVPNTGAQSAATPELVSRLRDETIPAATQGTNLTASVTGTNAIFVDLDKRITDRLFLFIALVIAVALVILGAAFRSVAIPIKAAVLDLLTIFATYGVLVAFLTYGWGRSLIGIPQDIPILSLLAPVFFAILFGLSNDYEVYLVSRMGEELDGGAPARLAVRRGQGAGSRTVVAAALIMIFVFASYMAQPGAAVKQFGFGMTAAILLDAFVTRMVILPAIMYLGGARMWWPGRKGLPTNPSPELPTG